MLGLTEQSSYRSPPRRVSWFSRRFPTLVFYSIFLYLVVKAARQARAGRFTIAERVEGSLELVKALERVGVRFEIENLDSFRKLDTTCVFICNHMSTLETLAFSCIIEPYREITFVVKESLVRYPVFKHIMISRNPVVVSRRNPRQDLEVVLRGGEDRLRKNVSMVVFPQTTRSTVFDKREFNTVGIKLARRAGVPIVPVALKTDAWGNSDRFVKDFGRIDPSRPVRIRFGDPIYVKGSGKEEHQRVVDFIGTKLAEW